jgi:GT2 family glycosyltransferase
VEKFPSRERSVAATLEPRVTAVVVVHKMRPGRAYWTPLDLCLRSALAEPSIDELVVVDHDNEAEISSGLRAFQADRRDVKLVNAPRAASAAAAANLGAEHARGRWLLFLDPAVVLQRGAVTRLSVAGNGIHTPWIIGGRLTDMRGRDRRVVRAGALTTFSAVAVAMGLPGANRAPRRRRSPPSTPTKVAAVSGALMLMPRSEFHDLRGFDEAFATDAADLDLCRRAADVGGSVLFLPAASGVQFERAQPGRRQAQGLALFASKSAKTPIEKAFALIARPALMLLVGLKDFVIGRPPLRR